MTNYFVERFPLRLFEVALVVVCEMFNFTPDFFMPSYQNTKIRLPDVEQRARERGFTTSPYEHCGFLKEYKALLDKLRRRVAERAAANSNNPAKATPRVGLLRQTNIEDQYADNDLGGYAKAVIKGLNHHPQTEQSEPMYNPTMLVYQGDAKMFQQEALTICHQYFPQLDPHTLNKIWFELAECKMMVPCYRSCKREDLRADRLEFSGVERMNGQPVLDARGNVKGLLFRMVPGMDSRQTGNGRQTVKFPVHLFMYSWHEILYLALSAPENEHSRHFSTVLPLQLRNAPDLLHRWEARSNKHHEVIVHNPRAIPNRVVSALQPGNYADFNIHLRQTSMMNISERASKKNAIVQTTGNIEMAVFERHLRSVFYQPPRFDGMRNANPRAQHDGLLRDWTAEKDLDERFKMIVRIHPNAPGAFERAIALRHKTFPFFQTARFRTLHYPDDIASEMAEIRERKKAFRFAEQLCRQSAGKIPPIQNPKPLTDTMCNEFRRWLREEEANTEEDRLTKLDLLDWLQVWQQQSLHSGERPEDVEESVWNRKVTEFKAASNAIGSATIGEKLALAYWGQRLKHHRIEKHARYDAALKVYHTLIAYPPPPSTTTTAAAVPLVVVSNTRKRTPSDRDEQSEVLVSSSSELLSGDDSADAAKNIFDNLYQGYEQGGKPELSKSLNNSKRMREQESQPQQLSYVRLDCDGVVAGQRNRNEQSSKRSKLPPKTTTTVVPAVEEEEEFS